MGIEKFHGGDKIHNLEALLFFVVAGNSWIIGRVYKISASIGVFYT